ncbi:transposase [Falsigemmobacter faecalis]|uniref:Transposase DDE domain-containing protein n=1 Tax=Falsigemmobacter faecalis TaxID=2488730 RepID=A0A3P3DQE0_9RHOB|nr:hypothetical protein EG244_06340 [Falsigemmobacter faecalis]
MADPINRSGPDLRRTNRPRDNRALIPRGLLMGWATPDMPWFTPPGRKVGQPGRFSAAAIQFCLAIKVLSALPQHQETDFMAGPLRLSVLGRPVPDYRHLAGGRSIRRFRPHIRPLLPARRQRRDQAPRDWQVAHRRENTPPDGFLARPLAQAQGKTSPARHGPQDTAGHGARRRVHFDRTISP